MKLTSLLLALGTVCAVSAVAPAMAQTSTSTSAEQGVIWRLGMSPYTYHWSRDPDHRDVYMIGLERQGADKVVWGGSYFRNSFGQPSGYLYGGKRYDSIFSYDKLFV